MNENNMKKAVVSKTFFAATLISALGLSSWLPSAYAASPFDAVSVQSVQQANTIKGKVVDSNGDPVIGASVVIKGTAKGAITDINGAYQLDAPAGSTIVVSYIGYTSTTIKVGNARTYNVTLQEDSKTFDDVVVTAMGIKKERKALGYAVTDLKSSELMKNKNTNVINSLAGKVPGVNITQSSGAAGAGANIIIRGSNSTAEGRSNQPLFVVDGVIYDNSTTIVGNSGTDGMTRNATTFSNRVMDINPEDIETMSVLKGAAAAALYGSRAADGAIIITTKKGAEGTVKIDYSGKLSTSWATKLPETQKQFGRGSYSINGVFSDQTYNSWGEAYTGNETLYDNIGTFFRNGTILDNNVSISGGSKNQTFYLSLSNYDQQGIVRKTGYNKTTVRFNGEQKFGKLTVGANVTYSVANTDKTLTSGGLYDSGGTGTMLALYGWPLQEDMSHYLNEDGTKYRLFDGVWDLASDKENPYWIINKDKMTDKTNRFTGALSASFKVTDWWDLSARFGYDNYTTDAYTYIAPGSVVKEIYQNGRLSKSDYRYEYYASNVMSNFHKTFGDFGLNLMLGTTSESTKRINQTHWGYNFIGEGTIGFNNISSGNQFFKDNTIDKRLVGVYGEFRVDYKNIAYVTVTGRNDWSSTLPVENRSYFYPSVSGAFVFTELLPKNNILSFGKVRASWAQVGKDADPYATLTYLAPAIKYGSFNGVGNAYTAGNAILKPEIQTAWEIGAELRFLDGRLGVDWTYYHSSTKNQIAQPRLSNANGYIMSSINSGSVINKGMEVSLTAKPIMTKDFQWETTLNFSYNKGTLGTFLEGVGMFYPTDAQFGTIKSASVPNGGNFLALVGTRYEYEKDANGNEIIGGRYVVDKTTGLYKTHNSQNDVVGNREPDLIGGWNNTFTYKDLSLSFLLDFRLGGDVFNGTSQFMVNNGLSPITTLNDRKSVTVTGVTETGEEFNKTYYADEQYTIGTTTYDGKSMIQQYWANYAQNSYNFIQKVNWLKLRSISLTYDLSRLISKQNIIKRLSVNVTGQNLFTITNYKGMDPEVSTAGGTGGSGATGIDYCSVPSVRSVTFGVNVTF
jgi:TonB-linked SusC/RagA family outer membrane protein